MIYKNLSNNEKRKIFMEKNIKTITQKELTKYSSSYYKEKLLNIEEYLSEGDIYVTIHNKKVIKVSRHIQAVFYEAYLIFLKDAGVLGAIETISWPFERVFEDVLEIVDIRKVEEKELENNER